MSKIAEQKALEAYPMDEYEFDKAKKSNIERSRYAYIKGYDQAMQDFMEKAEKFFKNELYVSISDKICSHNNFTSVSNFIEQFKNYMQNESEN
jgi:hypothetical protein